MPGAKGQGRSRCHAGRDLGRRGLRLEQKHHQEVSQNPCFGDFGVLAWRCRQTNETFQPLEGHLNAPAGTVKLADLSGGKRIDIPILPELKRTLAEYRQHLAQIDCEPLRLCANSKGRPWTLSGFESSFRKQLKRLEGQGRLKSGLTFHGLRHTVASVLAENGISLEDIAAVLGQKSSQMAKHYSQEADRSKRTLAAFEKFMPLGETTRKGGTNKPRSNLSRND